jgi:dihydroorotate dehydrogenase electron transfer subunit
MKNVREELCAVVGRREAGDDRVVLIVKSDLAAVAKPGQFVNVKIPGAGLDPFLRRPFSVAWAEPAAGLIELLVEVRGRGTAVLGAMREGSTLSLLGPLGRGFPVEELAAAGGVDLVAGACGVAPLLFLGKELRRRLPEGRLRLLVGARGRGLLPEPAVLAERFPDVRFATDDGSLGFAGDVVRLFRSTLDPARVVCACGPAGFLEAMRRVAIEKNLRCLLSLESHMACGYGVCRGCVVALATGAYATVCRDGPVFEAAELGPLGPADEPAACPARKAGGQIQ